MSIHHRIDFKLESHLHIIERKCVSEFEILNAIGEENSIVKASLILCGEEMRCTHTLYCEYTLSDRLQT